MHHTYVLRGVFFRNVWRCLGRFQFEQMTPSNDSTGRLVGWVVEWVLTDVCTCIENRT